MPNTLFETLKAMGLFSSLQAHQTEHSATPSSNDAELDIDWFFAGHDKIFKEQAVQTLYAKRVIILNDWFLSSIKPFPVSVEKCIEALLLAGFSVYLPIGGDRLNKIDTIDQLENSLDQYDYLPESLNNFTYLPEQDIYQLASTQLSLSPNEVRVANYLELADWCQHLKTGNYVINLQNYIETDNDPYPPDITREKAFLDYVLHITILLLEREDQYPYLSSLVHIVGFMIAVDTHEDSDRILDHPIFRILQKFLRFARLVSLKKILTLMDNSEGDHLYRSDIPVSDPLYDTINSMCPTFALPPEARQAKAIREGFFNYPILDPVLHEKILNYAKYVTSIKDEDLNKSFFDDDNNRQTSTEQDKHEEITAITRSYSVQSLSQRVTRLPASSLHPSQFIPKPDELKLTSNTYFPHIYPDEIRLNIYRYNKLTYLLELILPSATDRLLTVPYHPLPEQINLYNELKCDNPHIHRGQLPLSSMHAHTWYALPTLQAGDKLLSLQIDGVNQATTSNDFQVCFCQASQQYYIRTLIDQGAINVNFIIETMPRELDLASKRDSHLARSSPPQPVTTHRTVGRFIRDCATRLRQGVLGCFALEPNAFSPTGYPNNAPLTCTDVIVEQLRNRPVLEQLAWLQQFCHNFAHNDLVFDSTEVANTNPHKRLLDAIIAQQVGSCEHRSFAFAYLCAQLGMDCTVVRNDVHRRVEISLPGDPQRYLLDLGGTPARLTVRPVVEPLGDLISLATTPPPRSPKSKSISAKSNPPKSTPPTSHSPPDYPPFIELTQIDTLSADSHKPLVLAFSETDKADRFIHDLLTTHTTNCLLIDQDTSLMGWKFDPDHPFEGERIATEFTWFLNTGSQTQYLIINCLDSGSDTIRLLNELGDNPPTFKGRVIPSNVRVVLLMSRAKVVICDDNSFRSRYGQRILNADYYRPLPLIPVEPLASADHTVTLELYHRPSALQSAYVVPKIELTDTGRMTLNVGELVNALTYANTHPDQTIEIELSHPPQTPEFRLWLQALQAKRYFYSTPLGQFVHLPTNVQIRVSDQPYAVNEQGITRGLLVGDSSIDFDYVLNQTTFSGFFSYLHANDTHHLTTQPGWIDQANPPHLTLWVTDSLSLGQYAQLIAYAQHKGVSLHFYAREISLLPVLNGPIDSLDASKQRTEPTDGLDVSDITFSVDDHAAPNADSTPPSSCLQLLFTDQPDYLACLKVKSIEATGQSVYALPITAHTTYAQCVGQLVPLGLAKELTYRYELNALALHVIQGHHVVLYGSVSSDLLHGLASLTGPCPYLLINGEKQFVTGGSLTVYCQPLAVDVKQSLFTPSALTLAQVTNLVGQAVVDTPSLTPDELMDGYIDYWQTHYPHLSAQIYQTLRDTCHTLYTTYDYPCSFQQLETVITCLLTQTGTNPFASFLTDHSSALAYTDRVYATGLPIRFNPFSENYADLVALVTNHRIVMLQGETGVGKTYFTQQLQSPSTQLYWVSDREDIKRWARAQSNDSSIHHVLCIDEANLVDPQLLDTLTSFSPSSPFIVIEGQRYELNTNQHVILLGNPTSYGRRYTHCVLERTYKIPFVRPNLDETLDYLMEKLHLDTPHRQIIKTKIKDQIQHDQPSIRYLEQLLLNGWFLEIQHPELKKSLTIPPLPNFILRENWQVPLQTIQNLLTIRSQKMLPKNLHLARKGQNGILLTGEPSLGKTKVIGELLTTLQLPYHRASSQSYPQLKTILEQAFNAGHIVVIDEINTIDDPDFEKLLLGYLSGVGPTGKPATHPGFMVIGTANAATFTNRHHLSKALTDRLTCMEIAPYSRSDVVHIVSHLHQVKVQDVHTLIETHFKPTDTPTVREVAEVVELHLKKA